MTAPIDRDRAASDFDGEALPADKMRREAGLGWRRLSDVLDEIIERIGRQLGRENPA